MIQLRYDFPGKGMTFSGLDPEFFRDGSVDIPLKSPSCSMGNPSSAPSGLAPVTGGAGVGRVPDSGASAFSSASLPPLSDFACALVDVLGLDLSQLNPPGFLVLKLGDKVIQTDIPSERLVFREVFMCTLFHEFCGLLIPKSMKCVASSAIDYALGFERLYGVVHD